MESRAPTVAPSDGLSFCGRSFIDRQVDANKNIKDSILEVPDSIPEKEKEEDLHFSASVASPSTRKSPTMLEHPDSLLKNTHFSMKNHHKNIPGMAYQKVHPKG